MKNPMVRSSVPSLSTDEAALVKKSQDALRRVQLALEDAGLVGHSNMVRWAKMHLPYADKDAAQLKGAYVFVNGQRTHIIDQ